jgi:hypothetical protein
LTVNDTVDPDGGVTSQEQDRSPRDSMFLAAPLRRVDGETVTVKVRNLSAGGLMAESPVDFARGDRIEVELRGIGLVTGHIAWAVAGRIGVAFERPIDPSRARRPVMGQPQTGVRLQTSRHTWRPPVR